MGTLNVSVVIPTYNRAALIGRAVQSALAALAPGDEVLVVDDGSTDATEQALAPYLSRIRYERISHRGAGASRNYGIGMARNPLVAFLDSDDEWHPDKIHLQRVVLQQQPEVLFCFSDFSCRIGEKAPHRNYLVQWHQDTRSWEEILGPSRPFSELGSLPPGREDFPVHVGDLYPGLMERLYVPTFTLVVRRERAGNALHFAEDLAIYEDWDCFGRLARVGPAAYLACDTTWNWGHIGPRVSDAQSYLRATSHLTMLQRIWGADAEFMARHGDWFAQVVAAQHVTRAKCLIQQGQRAEARAALRLAGGGSRALRVLTALPQPLCRTLLWMRRTLGATLKRVVPCLAGVVDFAEGSLVGMADCYAGAVIC